MSKKIKGTFIIDFDGTCVEHDYPRIGNEIGAAKVLKKLVRDGNQVIVSTMRGSKQPLRQIQELHREMVETGNYELFAAFSDGSLEEALNWFMHHDIVLYGIQTNPTQFTWTNSPKPYGNVIIDDISYGIPLVMPEGKRPYVDWSMIEQMLIKDGYIYDDTNTNT